MRLSTHEEPHTGDEGGHAAKSQGLPGLLLLQIAIAVASLPQPNTR